MTDTNRQGQYSAGLAVDQCNYLQGENNELWSFDLSTKQWQFLRPGVGRWIEQIDGSEYSASRTSVSSKNITKPEAREQHSSNAISPKKLVVFGGSKSNSDNYSPHQYNQSPNDKTIRRSHFNGE
jgi:hypothetical protein